MKSVLGDLEFGVHMMEGALEIPTNSDPITGTTRVIIRAATPGDVPGTIKLDRQL
jgi:hypothetical protein